MDQETLYYRDGLQKPNVLEETKEADWEDSVMAQKTPEL